MTTSDAPLDVDGFVDLIRGLWGDRVQGILHTLNDDVGERVEAREGQSKVIWGNSTVTEVLHGLSFGISMASFFQTNPASAERLYAEVMALALEGVENRPGQVIMDLFCGTGTIGQILAKHANVPVVGVDIVPQAIEDAREAATRNGVDNVTFSRQMPENFCWNTPSTKASCTRSCSTRRAQAFRPRPSAKSCGSKPSGLCTSAATPPPKPAIWWNCEPKATS